MSSSSSDIRGRADGDVEAISQARETLFGAFNATDLDNFMAAIADDVVFMTHGGPPSIVGKRAVRSSYKEFFERGPFIPNVTFSSDEVVLSGDWAFNRGTWVIIRTYKRSVRRERLESSYVMIWRRQPEGMWKLARLIWNGAPVPIKAQKTGRSLRKRKAKLRK